VAIHHVKTCHIHREGADGEPLLVTPRNLHRTSRLMSSVAWRNWACCKGCLRNGSAPLGTRNPLGGGLIRAGGVRVRPERDEGEIWLRDFSDRRELFEGLWEELQLGLRALARPRESGVC